MEDEGLDLVADGGSTGAGASVRKNIALKLKPAKGRGRSKKGKTAKPANEEEEHQDSEGEVERQLEQHLKVKDAPPEPTHKKQKLQWDHKVDMIGEKVVDPLIHCCEKCSLPILIYGRMIPCKHVFCFNCAKKTDKNCPRCDDPVTRIEQSALGTVFICTFGGSKHGVSGCRRTYLSARDLQSHITHRHLKGQAPPEGHPPPMQEYRRTTEVLQPHPGPPVHRTIPQDPRIYHQRAPEEVHPQSHPPPHLPPQTHHQHHPPGSSPHDYKVSSISVVSSARSNLITIPIQDDRPPPEQTGSYSMPGQPPPNYSQAPPGHPPQHHYPPTSHGPPIHHPPPHSQHRPPMTTSAPMMSHGGPPPHHGPPGQRYPGPHPQFEDTPVTPPFSQQGSHSPRAPWSGAPARGPRPPTSSASMGPPPRGGQPYYQ